MARARRPAPSLPECLLASAGRLLLDKRKQNGFILLDFKGGYGEFHRVSPLALPSTSSSRLAVDSAVPNLEATWVKEDKQQSRNRLTRAGLEAPEDTSDASAGPSA